MAKSTKHIVGAGGRKTKKRRPRKMNPIKPKPPRPRQPKPMPYYPETGSNQRPRLISEKDKQAIIKIWEDRNRSNNNTKLNP